MVEQLLKHCLSKCQQWPQPPHPGCAQGPCCLYVSSPSVCTSSTPTSQVGLSLPHKTQGLECPICASACSLPKAGVYTCSLLFPLSPLPGSQIPTLLFFFPSYPITCVRFLQPWSYRSLSASFLLFFSENCSTCRCISDVFMLGGEHILLLCHLHLPLTTIC